VADVADCPLQSLSAIVIKNIIIIIIIIMTIALWSKKMSSIFFLQCILHFIVWYMLPNQAKQNRQK